MYFFPNIKNLPYLRQYGYDYEEKKNIYDHVYDLVGSVRQTYTPIILSVFLFKRCLIL